MQPLYQPSGLAALVVEVLERRALASYTITPVQRRLLLDALAKCYCISTDRPHRDIDALLPFAPRGVALYPACIEGIGRRAVYERIARGGLDIDHLLAPWTPGFWSGLRLAAALRHGAYTEWYTWERSRPELVADLEHLHVTAVFERRPTLSGLRRLRRCPSVFLPVEDPDSPRILAGLFAGAVMADIDGETWLELPDGEEVRALLARWTIHCVPGRRRARQVLRVSPFFGVLVAHLMPPRSQGRMLSVRNAGACPFLAVVYWQTGMSRRRLRYMPFYDALPHGCSKASFFRYGWRRKELWRSACEMGITGVAPRLRDLMVRWFEERAQERQWRGRSVEDAAVQHTHASPLPDAGHLLAGV